jgi:outer membrane protein OmpA-like peptidoglycan-associated protein
VLLREAELIAIKGGILDEARALIAQADEAKVGKLAPRSLQAAKRYLAQADQELQRNRYEVSEPRKLAAQARYEARHATYLAQLIERVLKEEGDDQAGVEGLILSWEEPLKKIATEMELSAQFDKGMQAPMQEITEHASQQAQEGGRLKQELADRDDQLASLSTQLKKLESRLGGVSEERVALQRRVDVQERMRSSVAALEASFTPDEARVVRQGDDVVLSLLGIKFPSGRSTIDAGSAALMKKVQQGLALFPGASISVEGHTDANGSDSTNLILSQDRADAVRQYLVSNFRYDPEKISSVGYGEARPVATNETAAGRARNRRIDLVIHPEQR